VGYCFRGQNFDFAPLHVAKNCNSSADMKGKNHGGNPATQVHMQYGR